MGEEQGFRDGRGYADHILFFFYIKAEEKKLEGKKKYQCSKIKGYESKIGMGKRKTYCKENLRRAVMYHENG